MELFHEIYSSYINVVQRILTEAHQSPITLGRMEQIAAENAFAESALAILPKLTGDDWSLLTPCGDHTFRSRLAHPTHIPLSTLQKSWLKALLEDRRIRLFFSDSDLAALEEMLKDTKPLYREEDFYYFDRYLDGDPIEDPAYRRHFGIILKALQENCVLLVAYEGKQGISHFEVAPYQIQYSSKDDKFRLCCLKYSRGAFRLNTQLNLAKIKDCRLSSENCPAHTADYRFRPVSRAPEPVLLRISGERNSLERCMLHFASYEKHTEFDEEHDCYLCSIYYDRTDETELLIDILSFGPVVQVLGPASFLEQIKERVRRQHSW